MKLDLRFDFFKVPRLPTLPAAVVQIFLCLAQIGKNWVMIEPLTQKSNRFSLGVSAAGPLRPRPVS